MAFVRKFYVADTHFRHSKILDMCARPHRDIAAHDDDLIRRWNAVVREDDIVFHLGDFSLGLGDVDAVRSIFYHLNGKKILIIGNHDLRKDGTIHPTLAGLGWHQPPTPLLETSDCGQRVVLCHYALRTWPGQHRGAWHFYGHSHAALPDFGRSRDVGVDVADVDFTPRTFSELTQGFA